MMHDENATAVLSAAAASYTADQLRRLNEARLSHGKRQQYQCVVCGVLDVWSEGWQWYGSIKQAEEGPVPTYCPACVPDEAHADQAV